MSSRQKLETLWNSQLNELLAKKKNNNEAKKETNEAIEKYKIQSAQGLALRMLIADIQHVKTTDRLCGMTPEEEYQDYLQRYLSSAEHVQKLCDRYPELMRVTEQVMEQAEAFLQEFLQRFENDHRKIAEEICPGVEHVGIRSLGLKAGDPHNGGRSTIRVQLENGAWLYYKPHSIRKKALYQTLYNRISKSLGLSCLPAPYLDCGVYGWEAEIVSRGCDTVAEVQSYYYRMGIHLFLGYVLTASDLHGENLVACGEYPMIIDFETFPGYAPDGERKSSVLTTGLLPVLTWGAGGQAAVISALSDGEKIRTPFRMPVVKNEGRSDICIAHEPIELQLTECVVRLQGQAVNPADYTEELCRGFADAYRDCRQDSEAEKLLEQFFEGRFRILLRHSQQYAMYRLTSLHPGVLGSTEERRKLLEVLYEENMSERTKRLHDYEIESLMRMDIPYFELGGESRSLYDGDGNEYPEYLPMTPLEAWKRKWKHLGREDEVRQVALIRLSVALLQKEKMKRSKVPQILSQTEKQCYLKEHICGIGKWICDTVVDSGVRVDWHGLRFYSNAKWRIVPMGVSLYDGLSGIAVFLAQYQVCFRDKRAEAMFQKLKEQLFQHTDQLLQSKSRSDQKTGVLDGEGSLVNTYLMLYQITGKQEYRWYAERQFQYIEWVWEKTPYLDYMNGNAGAIVLAAELYRLVQSSKYLELSAQIEAKLWTQVRKMEAGAGFSDEGEMPLAGMAHGNSGFLMAYAALLKMLEQAGDMDEKVREYRRKEYQDKILQLLSYEDSLYSEEQQNWLDYREKGKPRVMNAWCHGAPGVLLSRMELARYMDSEQIQRDIRRSAKALFMQEPGDHICLCHGIAGHLLIMKKYLSEYAEDMSEDFEKQAYQSRYEQLLAELLLHLEGYGKQMAHEYYNPSWMNGIAGVGSALLATFRGLDFERR